MQGDYPEKYPTAVWDPVRVCYPVRKFPDTGISGETIGRVWRPAPEVLMGDKAPIEEMKEYLRDYNLTKELTTSQTTKDYGYKAPETKRFNKHTSCGQNSYIYQPSKRFSERVPHNTAHPVTVMKESYTLPTVPSRLTTDKDQYKHIASLEPVPPEIVPSWHKELEPLDTTHEGFEKYLDPYLTTSRLHHRPFTADQLNKDSASKDIITYYTFANIPWTRNVNKKPEQWRLPLSLPKCTYDREKFKEEFREIRTHNKLRMVPGTFRTESRDNYRPESIRHSSHKDHLEEDVKNHYCRLVTNLPTNVMNEQANDQNSYTTETSHYGSGRMITTVLSQHTQKNKRLEARNIMLRC